MNKRIIIAGLIASIAMAMIEMMYEGLFGVGFWSAPVFIAATILRNLQAVAIPVAFSAIPVGLGMMGHMMNSAILAFVFVALLGRFAPTRMTGAILGALYALVVFLIMWFIALPFIDPVMLNLNPLVFALSHVVWGTVVGTMVTKKVT